MDLELNAISKSSINRSLGLLTVFTYLKKYIVFGEKKRKKKKRPSWKRKKKKKGKAALKRNRKIFLEIEGRG